MEVLNSCLLIGKLCVLIKFNSKHQNRLNVHIFPSIFPLSVLIFVAVVSCVKPPTPEDIGTNFFLKASKSVPRIGRRTVDYENYFLKVRIYIHLIRI